MQTLAYTNPAPRLPASWSRRRWTGSTAATLPAASLRPGKRSPQDEVLVALSSSAPADLAERRLEQALVAGDRDAAEELTRRCYRQIYASLLSWCRNSAEAEDLTQEAFRKAWQSLASFRGQARFSTWMHRIAYTTFLNSRRATDRQEPLSEEREANLLEPAASPSALADQNQRQAHLRSSVEQLPEPFRATVLAHYWQEMTVAELAEAEGITTVAIRKRLAKARSLILELLEPAPVDASAAASSGTQRTASRS